MAKKTLPEYLITDKKNDLSVWARGAHKARELANKNTADEITIKKSMKEFAESLRVEQASLDNIIGKITITPDGQTACRVEFNINNGSLPTTDMPTLDKLFGYARPLIFEKAEVVHEIDEDPTTLIESLKNAGLDPWEHLKVSIKSASEIIVLEKGEGFTRAEAILPKQGLLAIIKENMSTFNKDAKRYICKYLALALAPKVVLGTKPKI